MFLDLGTQSLANAYLKKNQLGATEPAYPLRLCFCRDCHTVQLMNWVDRALLFEQYAYISSASPQLILHFAAFADEMWRRFPKQSGQRVVEIGSNDGILLKHFAALGSPVLGVDPAKNIVRVAKKSGIDTVCAFFDSTVAETIRVTHGPAGVITANNVLAHTDGSIHDILAGVKKLLAPDGVFVFEVQYIADQMKNREFDNAYHEHIYYFSLHSLTRLLEMSGLRIFDVKRIKTQGSSIRVYASLSPLLYPAERSVKAMLKQEQRAGLHTIETYMKFGAQPRIIKNDLVSLLKQLKRARKTIVGYGAPAKGNTLLQYCGIGPDTLEYIVDNSPYKQGLYTPGSHIPIYSPERLRESTPDYIMLLAWNYADSILEKEHWLHTRGVTFIKPIPRVTLITTY
jgi:SAM-dependent methyltransferase